MVESLCFRLMEPVLLMMKSHSQQAGQWARPLMAGSFILTTTRRWPLGWVLLAGVHPSICPTLQLSICPLSNYPFVHCPTIHLSTIQLSICPLSIFSFAQLSIIHWSIFPFCPTVHLMAFIHLSNCPFLHLSNYSLYNCPFIHLPNCSSIHLTNCHLWFDLKDGVVIFFRTYWYNFRLVCLGGPKEDSKPAGQRQTYRGYPHSSQEELLQWEPPSKSRTFTCECIFYLPSYRKHVLYVRSADSYKKLILSSFEPMAQRTVAA